MTDQQYKTASLGMPVELARQRLLEDEDTQKIAETFGVPVEEYVELILDYGRHPDKEPMLELIDDEDLEEIEDLPTQAEVLQWCEGVASGEIDLSPQPLFKDGISNDFEQERLRQSAGIDVRLNAPTLGAATREVRVAQDNPMGSVLREQLMNQRTQARTRNAAAKSKPKPPSRES